VGRGRRAPVQPGRRTRPQIRRAWLRQCPRRVPRHQQGTWLIVYCELRVLAVQIKGKRGTALVRTESLIVPANVQTGFRWGEQSLEFEKTKGGWVMSPVNDAAYVKGEVALQVLSSRLADLAKNIDATPEQEREERQIIRLLNLLVTDNSSTASAQSN